MGSRLGVQPAGTRGSPWQPLTAEWLGRNGRRARSALRCPLYSGYAPSLQRKGRTRGGETRRAQARTSVRRSARVGTGARTRAWADTLWARTPSARAMCGLEALGLGARGGLGKARVGPRAGGTARRRHARHSGQRDVAARPCPSST
jgi:hypothetical protein